MIASARERRHAARRDALADAAIETLQSLGYARTSLRDIARRTGLSLGRLHYYFADRNALIGYCVRRYKARFIAAIEQAIGGATQPRVVAARVVAALAASIRDNAETHRLWYDIRGQAMFDPALVEVVDEVETALIAITTLVTGRLGLDRALALSVYLAMDGHYRYAMQRHLDGDAQIVLAFERLATEALARFLPDEVRMDHDAHV